MHWRGSRFLLLSIFISIPALAGEPLLSAALDSYVLPAPGTPGRPTQSQTKIRILWPDREQPDVAVLKNNDLELGVRLENRTLVVFSRTLADLPSAQALALFPIFEAGGDAGWLFPVPPRSFDVLKFISDDNPSADVSSLGFARARATGIRFLAPAYDPEAEIEIELVLEYPNLLAPQGIARGALKLERLYRLMPYPEFDPNHRVGVWAGMDHKAGIVDGVRIIDRDPIASAIYWVAFSSEIRAAKFGETPRARRFRVFPIHRDSLRLPDPGNAELEYQDWATRENIHRRNLEVAQANWEKVVNVRLEYSPELVDQPFNLVSHSWRRQLHEQIVGGDPSPFSASASLLLFLFGCSWTVTHGAGIFY